jgi:ABC-type bacteriocin/lantibiotic exporter with double-glycine peptidase domain
MAPAGGQAKMPLGGSKIEGGLMGLVGAGEAPARRSVSGSSVSAQAEGAGLASSLFRYVIATSWMHQIPLSALTVAVFLLEVVPLEMQRRVVNDVVKHRPFALILLLCGAYAGAVLMQGALKLGLNIYRSWIGERAKRDLRRRVCGSAAALRRRVSSAESQGTAISMIVAEVEPIGAFVGSAISEPLLQAGVLATVIAYLVHIDPWMGAAALGLFLPQFVFVPLMQQAMNRRTGVRVWLLRQIGAGVIVRADRDPPCNPADTARIERVFRINMRIYELKFTMNFLMNLCSHLQIVAALLLGAWWVMSGRMVVGGVVAFVSGAGRLTDPWGDIVNYFREVNLTRVKFGLVAAALNESAADNRKTA